MNQTGMPLLLFSHKILWNQLSWKGRGLDFLGPLAISCWESGNIWLDMYYNHRLTVRTIIKMAKSWSRQVLVAYPHMIPPWVYIYTAKVLTPHCHVGIWISPVLEPVSVFVMVFGGSGDVCLGLSKPSVEVHHCDWNLIKHYLLLL